MGSRWARVRHNGYRDLMSDSECTGSFAPKLAWERYKRVLTYQYSNGYAPRTFIDGQIRDNNFSMSWGIPPCWRKRRPSTTAPLPPSMSICAEALTFSTISRG